MSVSLFLFELLKGPGSPQPSFLLLLSSLPSPVQKPGSTVRPLWRTPGLGNSSCPQMPCSPWRPVLPAGPRAAERPWSLLHWGALALPTPDINCEHSFRHTNDSNRACFNQACFSRCSDPLLLCWKVKTLECLRCPDLGNHKGLFSVWFPQHLPHFSLGIRGSGFPVELSASEWRSQWGKEKYGKKLWCLLASLNRIWESVSTFTFYKAWWKAFSA